MVRGLLQPLGHHVTSAPSSCSTRTSTHSIKSLAMPALSPYSHQLLFFFSTSNFCQLIIFFPFFLHICVSVSLNNVNGE